MKYRRYSIDELYQLIRTIDLVESVPKGAEIHCKAYGRSAFACASKYRSLSSEDVKNIKEAYRSGHTVAKMPGKLSSEVEMKRAKAINRLFKIDITNAIQIIRKYHHVNDKASALVEISEKYKVSGYDAQAIVRFITGETKKLYRKRVFV